MTLKDVRLFARAFTDWCLAQDDLAGFQLDLGPRGLHVVLDWPGGFCDTRRFGSEEARLIHHAALVLALDGIAQAARARMAAEFRDSGQPPG